MGDAGPWCMSRSRDVFLALLHARCGGHPLLAENQDVQRNPLSGPASSVTVVSHMSRLVRVRARQGGSCASRTATPPKSRGEMLRDSLLPTVELLHQRQASRVGDGLIADYLALDWLEWNGGTLRLTVTGSNVCQQLRAREANEQHH